VLLLAKSYSYRTSAFIEAAAKVDIQVVLGSEGDHVLKSIQPEGFLTIDFQEPETATDIIVSHQESHPIDAIVSVGDDGVEIAAMASAALSLQCNPMVAAAATKNKYSMRKMFADAGLPSPGFERFSIQTDPEEISASIRYPSVLKPLSSSASRGVIRVNDSIEFKDAFQRLRKLFAQANHELSMKEMQNEILIEDFIPGEEVILEGLLISEELHSLAIFDKPDPMDGPYFEETILVTPTRKSTGVQAAIQNCALQMVRAIGLREGPIHAEMRLNSDGVFPLEIAARSIGGYCSRALRFAGGCTLEELIIQHAVGVQQLPIQRESAAVGVTAVEGIEDAEGIAGIEEIILTIPIGHKVIPLPEGNQYLGFIFARAESPDEVEESLRMAHAVLNIQVSSE
jgi:biotin carboxylase